MFAGRVKAPFQGDGGLGLAMKAERSGALMAKTRSTSLATLASACVAQDQSPSVNEVDQVSGQH